MADEVKPSEVKPSEVSPTGKAAFALPPWAVWLLATIAASAGGCYTFMPLTPQEEKVAMLVAIVSCAALGLTPGLRKAVPVLLLVLGMGLSGCVNLKAFIVTGESLDQIGADFKDVAPLMASACEAKRLDLQLCRDWHAFNVRFKKLYRPVSDAWGAAADANDEASKGDVGKAAARLGSELARFAAAVYAANLFVNPKPTGGTP